MDDDWVRIPAKIESDTDRRTIVAILAANGLEVRIAKEKPTKGSAYQKFIEYRQQA